MSSAVKYLSASRRSSVNELCSFVGATRAQSVTLLENFNWNVAVRACLLLFILVLVLLYVSIYSIYIQYKKALLQVFIFVPQVPDTEAQSLFCVLRFQVSNVITVCLCIVTAVERSELGASSWAVCLCVDRSTFHEQTPQCSA